MLFAELSISVVATLSAPPDWATHLAEHGAEAGITDRNVTERVAIAAF